jgi:hypothetical protein
LINKTITNINLEGNEIQDEGIKSISVALETNNTISTINLGISLRVTLAPSVL